MREKYYYVETDRGCAIYAGHTLEKVRGVALREHGTDSFKLIRPATTQDLDWVRGMGGYVPRINQTKKGAAEVPK